MLVSDKLEIAKRALQSSFVVEAVWRTKAANLKQELEVAEAFCDCIRNDQQIMQDRIDALEAELERIRREETVY